MLNGCSGGPHSTHLLTDTQTTGVQVVTAPAPSATCSPKARGHGDGVSFTGDLTTPRLETPKLQPVTGLSLDRISKELLLKTSTGIHIWDLDFGRQRRIVKKNGRTNFTKTIDWPGGRVSLDIDDSDGTVAVLNRNDLTALARIQLTDKGWMVLDNQGRFDGDLPHWDKWQWTNGTNTIHFSQLADLYYEPALLARLATGADFSTKSAPAITNSIAMPPLVNVNVKLSADKKTLYGSITAFDQGGCVGAVRVFHNGKAIAVKTTVMAESAGLQVALKLPAALGANNITAIATSALKIESAPVYQRLQNSPELPAQGRLVLLTVGIDHYANPTLTLNLAVADAQAMANWGRHISTIKAVKKFFSEVEVIEIYNADAHKERIRQALLALEKVDPTDTVLIYLAGHGENDGTFWYFLPSNFGTNLSLEMVTKEGLSSKELRDILIRIPARNIMVMLDACKSGGLNQTFATATDERYLEWVSRTTGVHILAATDQEQLAAEITELRHGALTFTILQALQGVADTTPKNGVVTVTELSQYALKELPVLTNRTLGEPQYPTVFNYGINFPLSWH